MEHFYESIPGWSTMEDQGELIKTILQTIQHKNKLTIAEIGVYLGRGTAMWNTELINSGVDYQYYALDHFKHYYEQDNKATDFYAETLNNLKSVLDKISLVSNDSSDEASSYSDKFFDVIYIDGAHDYDTVKKDIQAWLPKLKDDGIICGDDYTPGHPGVVKAVDECIPGSVQIIGNQQWLFHNRKQKVALVCIAKDEEHYIQEWVSYHKKLGFDKIYIYQNNWRTDIMDPIVEKIEMDGHPMQATAYLNFIDAYSAEYDWVAFFDVDEFLVLKKHKNIHEFISDYSDAEAIGINWVLFGDNNLLGPTDYSVLSRFTSRQTAVNPHIKSVLNLRKKIRPIFGHIHSPDNYQITSPEGSTFAGPHNHNGSDQIAQLNHYFGKTYMEFLNKIKRGDVNGMLRDDHDFHRHNFNEIKDFTALKFYTNG